MGRVFSPTVTVQIDECPECGGLWLDADELAAIRR
jgi:Zn-finger nucleic acid-binding protein